MPNSRRSDQRAIAICLTLAVAATVLCLSVLASLAFTPPDDTTEVNTLGLSPNARSFQSTTLATVTTTTTPPVVVAAKVIERADVLNVTPTETEAPPVTVEPWQQHPAEMSDVETIVCGVFGPHCGSALAVAECESGLNPNAGPSPTDDWGLFQLHRDDQRIEDVLWWDNELGLGLGWNAVFNPYVNSALAYSQSNGGTDWSTWTCGYAA